MAKIKKQTISLAKKPKKSKITSVTIRENRGKDFSPVWTDVDSMTAPEYLLHFQTSMQYYNIQFNSKDLKPAVLKWMELNAYEPKLIQEFKKTKDWRCGTTMGALASCLLRGMPEKRDDFNKGRCAKEWLNNAIYSVIEDSKDDIDEDDGEKPVTKQQPSIQERVKDATIRMAEGIEEIIDNWINNPDSIDLKQIKILNILKSNDAKPAHARIIKDFYSSGLKEITELLTEPDEQLKEAYQHRTKKQLNTLLSLYKEIDAACTMLMEEAKLTRAPRAKKAVSKDKIVEKLKYLKTYEPLKLVSINPTDIINSKELWIFNTKTRKLGKYVADELTGPLTIKGTTIIGYDEHKSIQKTIRKPAEKLSEFKTAGKIALRKFLDDINATDTKLNGRINEEIILLKTAS
jgi:hypothetical protein